MPRFPRLLRSSARSGKTRCCCLAIVPPSARTVCAALRNFALALAKFFFLQARPHHCVLAGFRNTFPSLLPFTRVVPITSSKSKVKKVRNRKASRNPPGADSKVRRRSIVGEQAHTHIYSLSWVDTTTIKETQCWDCSREEDIHRLHAIAASLFCSRS